MRFPFTRLAGIARHPKDSCLFASGKVILFLMLILITSFLEGQNTDPKGKTAKRKIEVLHADEVIDVSERSTGRKITRLLGNVSILHNEVNMKCDSAHLYQGMNQIRAYRKIHIQQGDTLNLFSDYLFYDGTSEIAIVKGNVELIDKETHLFTDSAEYDVARRIARYNNKGRIINGENILTSIIGIYYVSQNLFNFKDSVKIVNPDYVMTADTMDYNTDSETAFFTGPTILEGDSIYIYCEKGWYDTKTDLSRLWKNAVIDNRKQIIHGDSLYYDKPGGYGEAFGNVNIADSTNNIIIRGNYAWYYRDPEQFMVTDRALFIQISRGDSLFLHADTISAITSYDTLSNAFRLMRAWYGCRIFSEELQAKCDSLSYSYQDSVIRLYANPVIWSKENQLTADSMAVFTRNSQTDRLELYNSAFVTSQIDDLRFNQVKGRMLTGYFENNELYKIDINGNGETIYFLVDGDEVLGVNRAKCSRIEIFVADGKISEIFEYQNPSGILDPPQQNLDGDLRLDGFEWLDRLRPKIMTDVFKKP
jgi:lipopolysaccharide export system protein LptA